MAENNIEIKDIATLSIAIIALVIPTIFFFVQSPNNVSTSSYIIFGIIILFIIISSFLFYFFNRWKVLNNDVNRIKRDLNIKELYNNMDVRLKVVESLLDKLVIKSNSKKGQFNIDPRIIFWILLILLILLFLKSVGLF